LRVAVVGAGVMGNATAWALARRGVEVDLYEQFDLQHARGSSHGDARIFRISYPQAEYVALALESLPLWRELEAESDEELLRTTGSLDIGEDLPHAAAMDAHGVEYEPLSVDDLRARYGIAVSGGGVLQPDGGVLHADRCRRAFARRALAAGVRLHERARIDDLDAVEADVVVVTAGSWVNRFGFELPVRVTRETVAYFDIGRSTPTVIDWGPELLAYALMSPDALLKVGLHMAGHETDPDLDEGPNPDLVAGAQRWVERRFGVAPEPQRPESCLYTTTPDETFVLERRGRYVIGSACSGHGFKFAPAVGERLAALALAT
jgi:sarcosine oxidase